MHFAGHQRDAVHRSDPTDLMRRLVKEDFYTFQGTKLFPERKSYAAEYELSDAEKALGRMPKDVSAQRGLGYDIESIDADGNLFFIEVKGRADGADSVTLTINEVNIGRNAPHRFRLALVSVEGDRASTPVYVSGVDWGLPGFGDTQITKNLQQLLAAGRAPH